MISCGIASIKSKDIIDATVTIAINHKPSFSFSRDIMSNSPLYNILITVRTANYITFYDT